MKNNKAQGLPINFIVIAAIAVLILIIVVAFALFNGMGKSPELFEEDIYNYINDDSFHLAQDLCNQKCNSNNWHIKPEEYTLQYVCMCENKRILGVEYNNNKINMPAIPDCKGQCKIDWKDCRNGNNNNDYCNSVLTSCLVGCDK